MPLQATIADKGYWQIGAYYATEPDATGGREEIAILSIEKISGDRYRLHEVWFDLDKNAVIRTASQDFSAAELQVHGDEARAFDFAKSTPLYRLSWNPHERAKAPRKMPQKSPKAEAPATPGERATAHRNPGETVGGDAGRRATGTPQPPTPTPRQRTSRKGKGFDTYLPDRVRTASDIAEVFGEQVKFAKEDSASLKQDIVNWGLEGGTFWHALGAVTAEALLDVADLSMDVAAGMTEPLNLGKSTGEHGARGVLTDLGRAAELVPGVASGTLKTYRTLSKNAEKMLEIYRRKPNVEDVIPGVTRFSRGTSKSAMRREIYDDAGKRAAVEWRGVGSEGERVIVRQDLNLPANSSYNGGRIVDIEVPHLTSRTTLPRDQGLRDKVSAIKEFQNISQDAGHLVGRGMKGVTRPYNFESQSRLYNRITRNAAEGHVRNFISANPTADVKLVISRTFSKNGSLRSERFTVVPTGGGRALVDVTSTTRGRVINHLE